MPTNRQLDFTGFVSAQDPRTYPTNDSRNLSVEPPQQPQNIPTDYTMNDSPTFDFAAMIQQLKQAQAFGYQQQNKAQDEQFRRGTSPLPSDLANKQLSPNQIRGFRSGEVNTINPTISGARGLVQEASRAISEYQQSQKENQDKVKATLELAAQGGSQAIEGLLKTNPEIFKLAGIEPNSFLAGIKAKEAEAKRQFNLIHAPKPNPQPETNPKISPIAQAVIDGVVRLEDLTPTVRGQIAPELATAGFKSGPKLSSGQQDDLATMDVLSQQISQLQQYTSGGLEGIGGFGTGTLKQLFSKNLGISSEEGNQVRAIIGNLKGTIAKLRGGTSFTPNEEKLLATYTPGINESTSSIVSKLVALNTFLTSKKQALLGAAQERGVKQETRNIQGVNYIKGIDGLWHKQ